MQNELAKLLSRKTLNAVTERLVHEDAGGQRNGARVGSEFAK
jgi:hypothetical protein